MVILWILEGSSYVTILSDATSHCQIVDTKVGGKERLSLVPSPRQLCYKCWPYPPQDAWYLHLPWNLCTWRIHIPVPTSRTLTETQFPSCCGAKRLINWGGRICCISQQENGLPCINIDKIDTIDNKHFKKQNESHKASKASSIPIKNCPKNQMI